MSDTKDTEIRSKYDSFSMEELTEELKTVFFCNSEITDSVLTEMEQIMSAMRRKDPMPQEYSGTELWERFREVHGEELSTLGIRSTEEVKEKKSEAASVTVMPVPIPAKAAAEPAPTPKRGFRKLLHTALIAAAVVAAMVIITASASAAGINIWGWVQVRDEGTVRFVPEGALSVDIPTALIQVGVEEPLFPTWLPEGFILCEQQIRLEEPIRINSTYVCRDKSLYIVIRSFNSDLTPGLIEIEDESPREYHACGVVHYIITNCDQLVAYWVNGGFLVNIAGHLSVEEMEHIIESVYEEV